MQYFRVRFIALLISLGIRNVNMRRKKNIFAKNVDVNLVFRSKRSFNFAMEFEFNFLSDDNRQ